MDRTIGQVRYLSLELPPSMLDYLSLVAALRRYLYRQTRRVGYRAVFDADPSELHLDPTAAPRIEAS